MVSDFIVNQIINKNLSNSLKLKLLKRGFAKIDGIDSTLADSIPVRGGYPSYFLIELTKKCNLHCKYCFKDFRLAENQDKISMYQLNRICDYIIRYCNENKLKKIYFQPWGGEPLLCIEEIIFAKKKFENKGLNVSCSVQTNGTLLTEKNVEILKKNAINVGVSIDGFEQIKNFQRPYLSGNGTYRDVVEGIKNLKKYNMNFGILTVITNKNIDKVTSIINHFVRDLNVKGFKLSTVRPNENQTEDLGVPLSKIPTFIVEYFNFLVKLVEGGAKVSENNISVRLKNLYFRDSSNSCKSIGCMGGISIISFDKEGNIYPCELTDHEDVIIGNINNESSLPELIENARKTKKYFLNRMDNSCLSCDYKSFCRGGCTAAVKYLDKSFGKKDKVECLINKTIYPLLIQFLLEKPHIAKILMG